MITRERALAMTPKRAAYLAGLLVPWALAIVYNAWERRDEIITWVKSRT